MGRTRRCGPFRFSVQGERCGRAALAPCRCLFGGDPQALTRSDALPRHQDWLARPDCANGHVEDVNMCKDACRPCRALDVPKLGRRGKVRLLVPARIVALSGDISQPWMGVVCHAASISHDAQQVVGVVLVSAAGGVFRAEPAPMRSPRTRPSRPPRRCARRALPSTGRALAAESRWLAAETRGTIPADR